MSEIQIDNWIHVIFFSVLIFLWRSAFDWGRNAGFYLLLAALLYGCFIEFAQEQWVAHRSFEMDDLIWDMAGSVLGLLVWTWAYRKK